MRGSLQNTRIINAAIDPARPASTEGPATVALVGKTVAVAVAVAVAIAATLVAPAHWQREAALLPPMQLPLVLGAALAATRMCAMRKQKARETGAGTGDWERASAAAMAAMEEIMDWECAAQFARRRRTGWQAVGPSRSPGARARPGLTCLDLTLFTFRRRPPVHHCCGVHRPALLAFHHHHPSPAPAMSRATPAPSSHSHAQHSRYPRSRRRQ